jgi:hypothetical protein
VVAPRAYFMSLRVRRLACGICWVTLAAACSRPDNLHAAATAQPSASDSAGSQPCTSPERVQGQPCRTGQRQHDRLPTGEASELELSHCPLDDCGSGGCAYDVYGTQAGCYRRLGTIHGAWIDIVSAEEAGGTRLRTWGRSGSTLVATDYDVSTGALVQRRQFACEYGVGKPLSPECPKL